MKESDIRPKKLMQGYVELSSRDADLCFSGNHWRDLPCVSCGSENIIEEFLAENHLGLHAWILSKVN